MLNSESNLEALKSLIVKKQTLNGNKCGTTIISLIEELNIDLNEMKLLVNELHRKKLIKIRQGINQKLIFLRG